MDGLDWTTLEATGAAALGEPPVALRQVARVLERARGDDEAKQAAAAKAFP